MCYTKSERNRNKKNIGKIPLRILFDVLKQPERTDIFGNFSSVYKCDFIEV